MFFILYCHCPLNKQSAVLILSILKTKINFPVPERLLHLVDDGLAVAILILPFWTNKHMLVIQCGGSTELLDIRPTLPVMYCGITGCSNELYQINVALTRQKCTHKNTQLHVSCSHTFQIVVMGGMGGGKSPPLVVIRNFAGGFFTGW